MSDLAIVIVNSWSKPSVTVLPLQHTSGGNVTQTADQQAGCSFAVDEDLGLGDLIFVLLTEKKADFFKVVLKRLPSTDNLGTCPYTAQTKQTLSLSELLQRDSFPVWFRPQAMWPSLEDLFDQENHTSPLGGLALMAKKLCFKTMRFDLRNPNTKRTSTSIKKDQIKPRTVQLWATGANHETLVLFCRNCCKRTVLFFFLPASVSCCSQKGSWSEND